MGWGKYCSFVCSCKEGHIGFKVSAILKRTLCSCGLQAKTTYWPCLDRDWIFTSNQCLVCTNHLSATLCLVDLVSASMAIDLHVAGLLQEVKSPGRNVFEFGWEKKLNVCVCRCVFTSTYMLMSSCYHQFKTHFRTGLSDIYDWSYLPHCGSQKAANADCSLSLPSYTFTAWDKGHERVHIYQACICNLW